MLMFTVNHAPPFISIIPTRIMQGKYMTITKEQMMGKT